MPKKYLSYGNWRNTPWTAHDSFPKQAVHTLRRYHNDPKRPWMHDIVTHIYEWTPEAEHIREIPESEWDSYMEAK